MKRTGAKGVDGKYKPESGAVGKYRLREGVAGYAEGNRGEIEEQIEPATEHPGVFKLRGRGDCL